MYICCVYIPPISSTIYRNNVNECDVFDQIESGVEKYKSLGNILIMGDLNSRTANEIDYITDDEFLNQDIQLLPNVDDFPRSNKDKVLDMSRDETMADTYKTWGKKRQRYIYKQYHIQNIFKTSGNKISQMVREI